MVGNKIIDELLVMTGLPQEGVRKEISRLIKSRGLDEASIGLEELRPILVEYLQDTFLEAKKTYTQEA